MTDPTFTLSLYLPAQAAAESEATLVKWLVAEGDAFEKDQALAQAESAKAAFDFEAPCAGRVVRILHQADETVAFDEPVVEIETADSAMKDWVPPAAADVAEREPELQPTALPAPVASGAAETFFLRGVSGYVPQRIVANEELVADFDGVDAEYVHQVTGIKERRWAAEGEKPSDMAYAAALESIRKADIAVGDIDAVIVSTTTPDVAMPSTACILQGRLNLNNVPAFDLNAACSGWLYALGVAQGLIRSGLVRHVLTVGVDLQSRLLDSKDRGTYFIFGDGAGAAIISAEGPGHPIRHTILRADPGGLRMARREEPGYVMMSDAPPETDPWVRLDGQALFRFASSSFTAIIDEVAERSGWRPDDVAWVVPHQANSRILKSAAKRCGVPFQRFCLNIERMGNTSSASIPLAIVDFEDRFQTDDRIVLCSVGAGVTVGAISIEW